MSPLGICFTFTALYWSGLLAFWDIFEQWVKLKQAYIVLCFDLSHRYITMKVSDRNQEKKKHTFYHACSLHAEALFSASIRNRQKNLPRALGFCFQHAANGSFPGPGQAPEMGDKGLQRVRASS